MTDSYTTPRSFFDFSVGFSATISAERTPDGVRRYLDLDIKTDQDIKEGNIFGYHRENWIVTNSRCLQPHGTTQRYYKLILEPAYRTPNGDWTLRTPLHTTYYSPTPFGRDPFLYGGCSQCLHFSNRFPDYFKSNNEYVSEYHEEAFLLQLKKFLDHCDSCHLNERSKPKLKPRLQERNRLVGGRHNNDR